MSDAAKTQPCPTCGGSGRVRDEREFGMQMRRRRRAAKLTLREVAGHMGKSVGYVSDLEQEVARRSGARLRRRADD
jgi:DnaJ-class molecular chaperone